MTRSHLPWGGPRNNEHMPFKGHRTMAQVISQRKAKTKRAAAWGFDPESLTRAANR